MQVGNLYVIQAQAPEDGRMDIVDMQRALDGAQADVVGAADHLALGDAATGHEHGKAPRVVVAAGASLVEWGAAELPAPDDQCAIEQAAGLEVRDQACDGDVGFLTAPAVLAFDIDVRVPSAAAAGVEFDKAHTTLYESAGEQTIRAELRGHLVVHAIELPGSFRLAGEIDGVGCGGLHAIGELVRVEGALRARCLRDGARRSGD